MRGAFEHMVDNDVQIIPPSPEGRYPTRRGWQQAGSTPVGIVQPKHAPVSESMNKFNVVSQKHHFALRTENPQKRYRKQKQKTRIGYLCNRGSRRNAAVYTAVVLGVAGAPLHAPASLRTALLFPPPFLQAPSACPTHQCPAHASWQPLTRRPPFPTLFWKTPSTGSEPKTGRRTTTEGKGAIRFQKQGGGQRRRERVQYGFHA